MKKKLILTLASVMMFNGVVKADVDKALHDLAIEEQAIQQACGGIKKSLDTIFGLSVATTVSSGLGTVAAGGALATGIAKAVKENEDGKIDKKLKEDREIKEEILKDYLNGHSWDWIEKDMIMDGVMNDDISKITEASKLICKDMVDGDKKDYCSKMVITKFTSEYLDNGWKVYYKEKLKEFSNDKDNKEAKTLGNVRTGLMAGATATSAVSMGTSLGATLTAKKLAEKMEACNEVISNLKMAISVAEAEEVDAEKLVKAREITSVCTGFDRDNIKTLKTTMTASAVVSGIGTATASAGTVTSILANSEKVRGDNSDRGKKKEKKLNLVSNIMAGVTAGTSGASTVLSATAIKKAKQDSEMAERCEAVLAQ